MPGPTGRRRSPQSILEAASMKGVYDRDVSVVNIASLAAGNHKRSNARRRGASAAFEVIPDEPKGAVIRGIDGNIGVVLPAQASRLRGLACSQHRLVEGKLPLRIVGLARREALARIVRIAAE